MSKKRSAWRNRSDGKTVKRNILAEFYSSRPVELIAIPAMRVLTRAAHLVLLRIELELRRHAGQANGRLIVTDLQFIEFGVHKESVAPALRELGALGIIRINHGRGGNAEHRKANRFLLNYLCGAVDAHEEITNSWTWFKTVDDAEKVARSARSAKDPNKVAYSRQNATRKKNSHPRKPGVKTGNSHPRKPGVQSHPRKPGVLSISRGGGTTIIMLPRLTSYPRAREARPKAP